MNKNAAFHLAMVLLGLSMLAYPVLTYKPLSGYWAFAPAVVGKNAGALSNLSAVVLPGYGKVYVGGALLGMDFQGSMGGAALAAAIIAGKPFVKFDYLYYLDDIAYNVTLRAAGPSGSALASTLTLLQLLGLKSTAHPAMTGMIGLGGEVLMVGGVEVKGKAVRAYGIDTFLVPVGEAVPIPGLKVVSVESIIDAAQYFTSQNVTAALGSVCKPPAELRKLDVFKDHYEKLYSLTAELIKKFNITDPKIERNLRLAQQAAEEGNYYAAASYAFTALIDAYTIYYKRMLNVTAIEEAKNVVLETVNELRRYQNIVPEGCGANYWSAEACAAVYSREYRLSTMLDFLEGHINITTPQNLPTVAATLARAKARAISIELWASAVERLAQLPYAPKIRNLELLAREAYFAGLASAKYALSLVPPDNRLVIQIEGAVDGMASAMYNGNYFKVLGLSSFTFETSANALGSIQNSTVVARQVMPLVVGRSYCKTPSFIAYNYSQYVDSLLRTDPIAAEFLAYTALYYAHLAEVNAFR
ncbi:MAG: hypothetical protein GXO07_05790 [Crenarchaeota archaeon]|nr:hypothetical protein [Thermoproteota archaeon]